MLSHPLSDRSLGRHYFHASFSPYLPLIQLERFSISCRSQKSTDIASFHARERAFIQRSALDVLPCDSVRRNLHLGVGRGISPMEDHLVEGRFRAQIHLNPFVSASFALPCAMETAAGKDILSLAVLIEIHLTDIQRTISIIF